MGFFCLQGGGKKKKQGRLRRQDRKRRPGKGSPNLFIMCFIINHMHDYRKNLLKKLQGKASIEHSDRRGSNRLPNSSMFDI